MDSLFIMNRSRLASHEWLVETLIIFLALVLRVVQLDYQPLWWDEGYSVFFATRDFLTMLARTAVDIHPPFYYALMQIWILLFGQSVIVLRLLSVAIGVATVPLIYLVGRQLFNRRVGLIASLLLAVSPLHVYYSQEVRMYGLLTLFALGSMALQIAILQREGAPSRDRDETFLIASKPDKGQPSSSWLAVERHRLLWVGYVLVTAGTLYVHYYGIFLVAAEIVVVMYCKYQAQFQVPVRRWIMAWIGVGALYLPWAIYVSIKLLNYVSTKVGIENYTPIDPLTFIAQHAVAFSAGHLSVWTWLGGGAILTIALVLIGVRLSRNSKSAHDPNTASAYWLSAILILIPFVLGFFVNLFAPFHPFGFERTLLFTLPIFLILVARGIDTLLDRQRFLGIASLAGVVLVAFISLYDFYTVQRYPDEDYRPLINEMQSLAQDGDLTLAVYPWQIGYLEAYYRGLPMEFFEVPSSEWINNQNEMDHKIAELRALYPRTWLLAYQKQGRLMEDRITNAFVNDFVAADDWYGNTRVEYFTQGDDPPMQGNTVQLAPDLTLISYGIADNTLTAKRGMLVTRFLWQAGSDAYSYSLRLVDATGEKRFQRDLPILPGKQVARIALVIPRDLQPGEYALELVAYRRADGTPLVIDGHSEITLGTVHVGQ